MWKKYITVLAIFFMSITFISSCCSLIDGDRNAIGFEAKADDLYKQGDYQNAVTFYMKAGEAFADIKQYDSAIDNYNKAKEILPELSQEIDFKIEAIKKKQ